MNPQRYGRIRALFHRWCEISERDSSADPEVFLRELTDVSPQTVAAVGKLIREDASDDADPLAQPMIGPDMPRSLAAEILEYGHAAPPTSIGPYHITGILGEGGFGIVYRAERREPIRQDVAIKVIKPGMDSRAVIARFEQERQALAVMNHPSIARIFDAGRTERGLPYFVMEYVRGAPLTEYCDAAGLTIDDRLRLFIRVCEAVQHAHAKGVIHRDLKPGNVMITESDDGPIPKVIDFGVAKAVGLDGSVQGLTDVPIFIGTPQYMSPEQADLATGLIDTRSDVYALGVMLFELLTGTLPFDLAQVQHAGMTAVRQKFADSPTPRPSGRISALGEGDPAGRSLASARGESLPALARRLRGELDWITMKAIAHDQNERYQGALALAADIRRFLHDDPVEARPPGRTYLLRKFVRRNQAIVASAAAVLIISVVAAVISVSLLLIAQTQRDYARQQEVIAREQRDEAELQRREAVAERERAQWQSYVANLAAAEASIRAQDVPAARQRLLRVPEEERRWEWRHLFARTDRSAQVWSGHARGVRRVALSADGGTLISISDYQQVFIRDGRSGEVRGRLVGGESWMRDAVVTSDGRFAAVASSSDGAWVADVARGEWIHQLRADDPRLVALAFGSEGDRLVTGSRGGTIDVWSTADGVHLGSLDSGIAELTWLELSADGRTTAVAGRDRSLRLIDVTTGEILQEVVVGSTFAEAMAFSRNGRLLMAGLMDGSLRLYDAGSLALIASWSGHASAVHYVAFSDCGSKLVSAGADRAVRIWDASTQRLEATLLGHTGQVQGIAVDDAMRIISASTDTTIRVWESGASDVATLRGHGAWVYQVAVSPDGEQIISGGGWQPLPDGTVRFWCTQSLACTHVLEGPADMIVWGVRIAPDGSVVAIGQDHQVTITDRAGEVRHRVTLHRGVRWVSFTPCSRYIAVALWDAGSTVMIDVSTGEPVPMAAAVPWWRFIEFGGSDDGPFGSVAVAADEAGSVLRLDGVSLAPLGRLTPPQPDFIPAKPALSACGRWLAMVWEAVYEVSIFDLHSDAHVALLAGHSAPAKDAAFSPDGTRVATASADGTVRLWSVPDGREIVTLHGHGFMVMSLEFSRDGSRLVSGSADGTIRIWDAPDFPSEPLDAAAIDDEAGPVVDGA